jgi:hypothetical protein
MEKRKISCFCCERSLLLHRASLLHTPYSPDLALRDFHFFPTLKRTLEGRRLSTHEDAEAAVRTEGTDFYQQWFFKLVKRWDKCISVGGDYVEK